MTADEQSQEGGRNNRGPVDPAWVTDIRDPAGGVQKKRAERTLEGRTWDEMLVRMNLAKV